MTTPDTRRLKVEFNIDPDLLAMIDADVAARFTTRTAWLIEAAVQRLERELRDRP